MTFKTIHATVAALSLVLVLGLVSQGHAVNISFTGNFTLDDDVQFFNFSVGAPSAVTLRTWSYAGGTNAAGQTIAGGGFDPILALFSLSGGLINQNDDGGCGSVSPDALTGNCYDTHLQSTLAPGNYLVSVQQYNNFANGPNLSGGFSRQGEGNFTALTGATDCPADQFISGSGPGHCRDSHWAFDILNVENATQIPLEPTPEPGTLILLGTSLAFGVSAVRRRRVRGQRVG